MSPSAPADLRTLLEAKYRFLAPLGTGAFGEVWRVEHREGRGEFALKLLAEVDPDRFDRELIATRKIEHPNLIRCHEGARHVDQAYLLLELADGSMEDRIGTPEPRQFGWSGLLDAARGVAALHAAGITHRDLKPDNLLVKDGRVKIADLGLAKVTDLATMTRTGIIQGTPGYMAPEQARGEKPGPAADVFALGVMFYLLLEGRLPYLAGTPMQRLMMAARGELTPWKRAPDLVSGPVLAQLSQCLEVDPSARPEDLSAWVQELAQHPVDLEIRTAKQTEVHERVGASGDRSATAVGPSAAARTMGLRGTVRAPVGVGGSRDVTPSSASWRRRSLAVSGAAVALGLVVVAALVRSPIPPPPPTSGSVLPKFHDLAFRVEKRFLALQGHVYDEKGELAPSGEGVSTVTAVEFPDPNPLRWDRTYDALPELAIWEDWLEAGGDPAQLDPEVRLSLREMDEVFVAHGVARPFHPYVYLQPAAEIVTTAELEGIEGLSNSYLHSHVGFALPRQCSGWLGTAVQRMAHEQVLLAKQEAAIASSIRNFQAEEGLPEEVWRDYRRYQISELATTKRSFPAVDRLDHMFNEPKASDAAWDWFRPLLENRSAITYALGRSMLEEPATRTVATLYLGYVVSERSSANLNPIGLWGRAHPVLPRRLRAEATTNAQQQFVQQLDFVSGHARSRVGLQGTPSRLYIEEILDRGAPGLAEDSRFVMAWSWVMAWQMHTGEYPRLFQRFEESGPLFLDLAPRPFWCLHEQIFKEYLRAKEDDYLPERAEGIGALLTKWRTARQAKFGPEDELRAEARESVKRR